MPQCGSAPRLHVDPVEDGCSCPTRGGRPCHGGMHGLREVHRPREGLRAGRPKPGFARRPPAVRPRSPAQGAARRPRGHGGRIDPARGRAARRRLGGRRAGAGQAPEGVRRRRRPDLPGARPGSRVRHGREIGRQGRRQVRHRRAVAAGPGHGAFERCCPRAQERGRHADLAQSSHQRHPQGPHRRQRLGRAGLRRAQALCPRPHRGSRRGQDRSRHRPRRGDPPHHPGAVPAHQEQSRPDRRARRRQDRHRRRPGAAHHQGRRARKPEGQEAAGARHGRPDRRRQIPR